MYLTVEGKQHDGSIFTRTFIIDVCSRICVQIIVPGNHVA